jgi:hypothetical protein
MYPTSSVIIFFLELSHGNYKNHQGEGFRKIPIAKSKTLFDGATGTWYTKVNYKNITEDIGF